MHCYPARIIHEDRMRTLRDEAAQARLAAELCGDRTNLAFARARGRLRQALARTSAWARRDPLTYRLGGSLRPATHPQLREDA